MRKPVVPLLTLIAAISLFVFFLSALPVRSESSWQAKVDPWVLETAQSEGETEFLVFLAEQADVSGAYALETKLEKGTYVFETLTETAQRTQGPVLAAIDQLGLSHRSFWVANMIWVRGGLDAVEALAERSDVAHIYANPTVRQELPTLVPAGSPETIEWNILLVNAPALWDAGYRGEGVVIGGQDTGYFWEHDALKEMYRGWDGSTADHDYNWHDAIHSGGGVCGPDSPEPCDDHGHGTHTMGTMVGDDGLGNQVGMAPGARWIGCRNMDVGNGTPATYTECYEWFIAPTDSNNSNPDPSKAPHVINNSWGCPASEGCTDPNALLTVVQNVRAAGILTAHAAGNAGPNCSTVNTPSAIYDESFSVGSTTSTDTISSFSSRGPVTVDGSGRLKPDISAPGSSIRSSTLGGGYGVSSGTSMAAPHVAGMVALLISANPELAGEVDELEALITSTAKPLTSTQECGGIPGDEVPNNTFGWGRIDVLAAGGALPHALTPEKSASSPTVMVGELLTYTLTLSHDHVFSATTNVVLSDTIPAGVTFVSATAPHTFDGATVTWEEASMDAGASMQVELVVSVDADAGPVIINEDYGALSDDVAYVQGPPITTVVQDPTGVTLTELQGISAGGAPMVWLVAGLLGLLLLAAGASRFVRTSGRRS